MDTVSIRDNPYEAKRQIEELTEKVGNLLLTNNSLRGALQMIAEGTSSCYQIYQHIAKEALKI